MTATRFSAPRFGNEIPQLRFAVLDAARVSHAALPTVKFALELQAPRRTEIRSVLLDVQIQIAARQRGYDDGEQEQLLELFGTPERWRTTLRALPWTRTTVVVPAFAERTVVDLPIACSYDLDVTAARYFAALRGGEVPLEFLFSGSVFFAGGDGALQATRIALDSEVEFRLPVSLWREAIDAHFPGSAWLRLQRDSVERLAAFKARGAYASWDAALEALLAQESGS
ncbi:MAG: hypothetical protein JO153_19535 [Solirubrobacterales bacterium]|nr:hypothetical protein [Solirubrobacterales bacterium]MBV9918700.1 hypothetical protein [Solirubrobacterales bacterium]